MSKSTTDFPTPGIYLHMPESVYHSIPAFSKSLVKKFRISPIDAWEMLYGDEDEEKNDALEYGTALHCFMLEGADAFNARYCKAFDKSEHPDALDTIDDLKKFLKSQGQDFKASEPKPVLIERVQSFAPTRKILEVLRREHDAASDGKLSLSASTYDEILSRDWIRSVGFMPYAEATEISFFWIDERTGIQCKARIDSLGFRNTPMGGVDAVIGDIKTFTNTRQRPVSDAVAYETGSRGYHIDALFYTRALKATPRVFHDSDFKIPDFDAIAFELLFIEKGKRMPNVLPREVIVRGIESLTELGQAADGAIQQAANQFKELPAKHGSSPWNSVHPAEPITEAEIPIFLL